MTQPPPLRALLWDLDGTLIDSEPYWMAAESELAADYGIPWGEAESLAMVGVDLWAGAEYFRERGVTLSSDEIVHRMNDRVMEGIREHIPFRPGAFSLLQESIEAGLPNALVTMSITPMANAVAQALEAELGRPPFAAQITGDIVERGKPDPEPYLSGAAALGIPAEDCVVIEDSFPGVASGLAAGAVVIGVPHAADIRQLRDRTEIWESLDGRTIDDVRAVFAARRSA